MSLPGSRRSQRTQGKAPELDGLATPARGRRQVADEALPNTSTATADQQGNENHGDSASNPIPLTNDGKSEAPKSQARSAASVLKKKQFIESDLKALEELHQLELEKQKLEFKQKLIKHRQKLERRLLYDDDYTDDDEEEEDEREDPVPLPRADKATSVQDWLNKAETDATPASPPTTTTSVLEKLLARQSVPKELPPFSGDPAEWQLFIRQYEHSTKMCGLTHEENALRLAKCLKGKAYDTVCAMLGVPDNVPLVISTLQKTFGRPDQVVKSLIAKAKTVPSVSVAKPESVLAFSNAVNCLVSTIKSLKCNTHLTNPQLLEELVQKLPYGYQLKWCKKSTKIPECNISHFNEWLTDLAVAACLMPTANESSETVDERANAKKKSDQKVPSSCFRCKETGHRLISCPQFQNDDLDARWKLVQEKRLCFVCIDPGHRTSDCPKKKECGRDGCRQFHNPLLHRVRAMTTATTPFSASASGQTAIASSWVGKSSTDGSVLLKILPVRLEGPKGVEETFALLDDGSTVSIIDADLAEKLGLDGQLCPLVMQWTKNKILAEPNSKKVTLRISGIRRTKRKFMLKNVRTLKDLSLPMQTVDFEKLKIDHPYLHETDFNSYSNQRPMILIGLRHARLISARKTVSGGDDDPVACKTALGWTIHGPMSSSSTIENVMLHFNGDDDDVKLETLVRDSFATDFFATTEKGEPVCNTVESRAEMLLRTTTERIGQRWQTGLLWKTDEFTYPESRRDAMRRLWVMERKMDADPRFADAYCAKINDYLAKGYARKLTKDEALTATGKTRYLPHFAVFNPNKPGKLRLVFDAASKSGGVSFNDALLKGPDLLKPIPAILWRFRRGKIGFSGDCREMFHQVIIKPEDQDSQRFLWRGKERGKAPASYVMRAMIFGATCSPASAIYVMSKNAEEFRCEFPDAADAVQNNTYMDDTIESCDNENDAIKRIEDIIEVNRRGGFEIVNWISSSRAVTEAIPPELRAKDWKNLDSSTALPTERILGMWWDAESDKFTFRSKFHKVDPAVLTGNQVPTKRQVLQLMASLFDPLGFVVHFVIKCRILFQDICKSKIGWDDTITEECCRFWVKWLDELKCVPEVSIPRCYSPHLRNAMDVQLHVFNDASTEAYASVAYLRIKHAEGTDVAFLCARARVKPLKQLSVPRMELQAAVMGCQLAATIRREIQLKIHSTVLWSDSQTVICWVKNDKKLPQWEEARVKQIRKLSAPNEWRWVATDLNPADAATRKDKKTEFVFSGLWYSGPEFLRQDDKTWPVLAHFENIDCNPSFILHAAAREPLKLPLPDPDRFTCWLKLIRTTAWILRIIYNSRHLEKRRGELRVFELKSAELLWVRQLQDNEFGAEIDIMIRNAEKNLEKRDAFPKGSKLTNVSILLDKDRLIRIKSRALLSHDLHDESKFPLVLGCRSRYVELFLDFLHRQMGHQGIDTVVYLTREKYWIFGLRNAVKRVVRSCQWCRNQNAKPCDPEMGILPEGRVNRGARPFLSVGADFFGPLGVTVRRKHEKRYGMIFTCMATRAVHIEMTESLTTDSTLNAIRRFAARRGYAVEYFCDNGANLRGSERELRELAAHVDHEEIQRSVSAFGSDWHFSPPATPHWGGSWERLIRSAKTALMAILKDRFPKQETLHTLLTEVEYILNCRPLTHVSVDPDDMEPLTPMHFLLLGDRRIPRWTDPDQDLRKQYQVAQVLADHFWTRWVKEYLPSLNLRPKWNAPAKPIEVGDVVLVVDPNSPRNSWPLGLVERVFPGRDGVVRVAEVRIKDGVYRRGVRNLVVLDVKSSS